MSCTENRTSGCRRWASAMFSARPSNAATLNPKSAKKREKCPMPQPVSKEVRRPTDRINSGNHSRRKFWRAALMRKAWERSKTHSFPEGM